MRRHERKCKTGCTEECSLLFSVCSQWNVVTLYYYCICVNNSCFLLLLQFTVSTCFFTCTSKHSRTRPASGSPKQHLSIDEAHQDHGWHVACYGRWRARHQVVWLICVTRFQSVFHVPRHGILVRHQPTPFDRITLGFSQWVFRTKLPDLLAQVTKTFQRMKKKE